MSAERIAAAFLVTALIGTQARAQSTIPLVGGPFKIPQGLSGFKAEAETGEGKYRTYALIILKDGWNADSDGKVSDDSERRIQVLRHVYGNVYLVHVDASREQLEQAAKKLKTSLAFVPWQLKLSRDIRTWQREPGSKEQTNKTRVLVRLYEDVTPEDALEAFGAADVRVGVDVGSLKPSDRCPCWEGALTDEQMKRLAKQGAVSAIEPNDPRLEFLLDTARGAIDAEAVQGYSYDAATGAGSFSGATGRGTIVGILDHGGLCSTHHGFWTMNPDGVLALPSRIIYAESTIADAHASHVAGIVGGSGGDSPVDDGGGWALRGVAPECGLVSTLVTNKEYLANRIAIVDHGAQLTNNSYGFSLYVAVSFAADNDAVVRGDAFYDADHNGTKETRVPPHPSIWGAGNNGAFTTNGNDNDCGYWSVLNPQKNGIVVGGSVVDDTQPPAVANTRWLGSSIGPTLDGRLKPDVMAPACKKKLGDEESFLRTITALDDYQVDDAYEEAIPCGTSYSTAFVTGVTALLLEARHATHGAISPYPSTSKAALIQGAIDMEGTSAGPNLAIEATPGPDFATGWGAVSAAASLAVVRERRVLEDDFEITTDKASYWVTVPDPAPRLRVTLAWDDPKSPVLDKFAPKLVNDLDLELFGPLESAPEPHSPWRLPVLKASLNRKPEEIPNGLTPADTGVDNTNNVEQVELTAPRPGTWEVRVRAARIANANGQTYSVASDYPLSAVTPAGTVTSSTGTAPRFGEMFWSTGGAFLSAAPSGTATIIPARNVCRTPGQCPSCARFGRCPPVRLKLSDLPPGTEVQILGSGGKVLVSASAGATGQATLVWPRDKDRRAFLKVIPPSVAVVPTPSRFGIAASAVP